MTTPPLGPEPGLDVLRSKVEEFFAAEPAAVSTVAIFSAGTPRIYAAFYRVPGGAMFAGLYGTEEAALARLASVEGGSR